jgi:hypothetical protein
METVYAKQFIQINKLICISINFSIEFMKKKSYKDTIFVSKHF